MDDIALEITRTFDASAEDLFDAWTDPEQVAQWYGPEGFAKSDIHTFEAKKGAVYWVEVFSQRLGLPTDPFMLVQRVTKKDKDDDQASDLQELYDSDTNIGGPEYNTATRDPIWRFDINDTILDYF